MKLIWNISFFHRKKKQKTQSFLISSTVVDSDVTDTRVARLHVNIRRQDHQNRQIIRSNFEFASSFRIRQRMNEMRRLATVEFLSSHRYERAK